MNSVGMKMNILSIFTRLSSRRDENIAIAETTIERYSLRAQHIAREENRHRGEKKDYDDFGHVWGLQFFYLNRAQLVRKNLEKNFSHAAVGRCALREGG